MNRSLLPRALLTAGLVLTVGLAGAEKNEDERKPLALQKIMRDLGLHMQSITDGISREDWELVKRTASLIADHPQPPFAEKARILRFMGSDAPRFRTHDGKTHDAAVALAEAAGRNDGLATIAAFEQLQLSCLGCHQTFRRPFVEHFYEGSQ